jgi:hypothetical protein
VKGGPKDAGANPQRDKLQADALAMYRAEYPNGRIYTTAKGKPGDKDYRPADPTAEEYVADYVKKKGSPAPAAATAPRRRPRSTARRPASLRPASATRRASTR